MRRPRLKLPSGPMLAHFTRASAGSTALDNLVAILSRGALRAGARMVRGQRPVVCLFDAALEEIAAALGPRSRHRYQPFGIALDKRYAFRMGARPVIYLPRREAERLLPAAELWRVVRLEIDRSPAIDWSFEREWRICGDLPFAPAQAVALVETWRDVDEIYDRFGGRPPCAGVIPLPEVFASR